MISVPHPAADSATEATTAAMAAAGLVPGQSPAPLRLPDPARLFQRRAARLRALASGHSLGGWLSFVATLADAQHALVAEPASAPPAAQWRDDLRALRSRLGDAVPVPARPALDALVLADAETLDALADRLTGGRLETADLAVTPFVAAALQVAWTRDAAKRDAAATAVHATAHACPVCGGAPVAGVLHVGMEAGGLRYLHCGVCHTAWHHVRSACVACGDGKEVSQRFVEGQGEGEKSPVRAETCDACHSYLKLLFLEKAPDLDPVADDLATLALDILVGDEGYQRIGGNPFLVLAG
ncbi:formate dehydrogenase accessory protein FdhE [Azospirillum doebereinerae]|uniref:Formate dehydrogenase accessory protein FdhE n=1 Tax=Azospirillum doebereinerae TaxID=92933 RepID=A0A3S0WXV6_9PROT|nr:formate dehydrogenase accessory protein FdhE [Azospirillum doebereinerae]RUQ68430.1 formate dehydrogenase accessory protein FdhE [Azospirillum doebereinerae]